MQSVSTNRVHASHPIQSTQVSSTQTTNFAEDRTSEQTCQSPAPPYLYEGAGPVSYELLVLCHEDRDLLKDGGQGQAVLRAKLALHIRSYLFHTLASVEVTLNEEASLTIVESRESQVHEAGSVVPQRRGEDVPPAAGGD